MAIMNCPSRTDLHAYSVGALSEDAARGVADHIGSCPACQAALQEIDTSDDVLVAQIRSPVVADQFLGERQFRKALVRAEAIFDEAESRDRSHGSAAAAELSLFSELDDYELLGELGRGGMGAVYKARHTRLKRMVAIKVLPINARDDGYAVARFEREMEAVGRVQHPNVVQAYDAREIQGSPILIMEFVEGVDLSKLIRRCGALAIADACEIVRQIALGLQAAHEQGLVHRDIKPSNVMLTPDGQVKVLDLGLALLRGGTADDAEASIAMTATGQTMGTADYMAPEQCLDSHTADIHSDIYSLGCVLYKLLAGHAPFSGPEFQSRMAKMVGHIQKAVPPIRDCRDNVPDSLVVLLDNMLAKNPADRPATPDEVASAINNLPLETEDRCRTAGLAALFARYQQSPADLPPTAPTSSTVKTRASALVDTRQNRAPEPQRLSLRSRLAAIRRKPWVIAQGALLFVCIVLAFQLVVRIKNKNGQETVVKVPRDSTVTIEKHGKTLARVPQTNAGTDRPISARDKTVARVKSKTDSVQSSEMIPMPTNLATGLVAHWAFDEGSGADVKDSVDFPDDGTLMNMDLKTVWSHDVPPSKYLADPWSLRFDGEDDYVITNKFSDLWVLELGFAAWIKTTNKTKRMCLLGSENSDDATLLRIDIDGRPDRPGATRRSAGDLIAHVRDSEVRQYIRFPQRNTDLCDGRWHHVAVGWNFTGQILQIFIDGVEQRVIHSDEGPKGAPHRFTRFEFPLCIGAINTGRGVRDHFDGLLDDVRLYCRRRLVEPDVKVLAARAPKSVGLNGEPQ